jgi:hypothetical protein
MNLKTRLSALDEAASDALLSKIWKDFAHTEAYEAFSLAVSDLLEIHESGLLSAETAPTVRAYHAGAVAALRRLVVTSNAAITFDPDQADYSSLIEDDVLPDEPMI